MKRFSEAERREPHAVPSLMNWFGCILGLLYLENTLRWMVDLLTFNLLILSLLYIFNYVIIIFFSYFITKLECNDPKKMYFFLQLIFN